MLERESAYHITSVVVVQCGKRDPSGFRGWRSGFEELERSLSVVEGGGFPAH